MADQKKRFVISDLRGGRNGFDPPWDLKPNECAEAFNVEWYQSRCGRPRGGTLQLSTTFSAGGPFTGNISFLGRYVPGTDETAAELWAIDDAVPPVVGRLAGSVNFSAPTLKDAFTGVALDASAATVNGKYFLAYKSAQARLHVWDGSTVRRAGLMKMNGSAYADTGAGAYAAVLRYYRTRLTVQSGGVTVRRSEPSADTYTAFTPSGAGTAVRITQGAVVGEGETHWEIEASTDAVTFYRIATVAIGTTTYDDSATTASYSNNPLSALTGTYTLQKSYRFIAGDQNRLLGFGSLTTTDKQDDIEVSAVVGSLDVGDAERVDTTTNYRLGLDENDSGPATGLVGPVLGSYFAFKSRQMWRLTPTGLPAQPYRLDNISKTVGALPRSMVIAEDAGGRPALYFMSQHGPYMWSADGLRYIGRNIEDLVLSTTAGLLNVLSRTHTIYHADKRQVWFWYLSGTDPHLNVYDVVTGGWSRYTGGAPPPFGPHWIHAAKCSAMFGETQGASMSTTLKPFYGDSMTANKIMQADTKTMQDESDAYVWSVLTGAFEPGGPGFYGEIGDVSVLQTRVSSGVSQVSVFAEFETSTSDTYAVATGTADAASAEGSGARSRVESVAQGTAVSGVSFVQIRVWKTGALSTDHSLDRLVVPYQAHEAKLG